MFLHEDLVRSQLQLQLSESQVNAHAIRAVAARRAHRRAQRSAHVRQILRSAVSSVASVD